MFTSADGDAGVGATIKANSGFLYPIPAGLCFLESPATFIPKEEIASVELARANGASSTFDVYCHLKNKSTVEFSQISRVEVGYVDAYITRNGLTKGPPAYSDSDSDDDGDGEQEKATEVGGEKRKKDEESDSDDPDDEDFNPFAKKQTKRKEKEEKVEKKEEEEEDDSSASDSESDSDDDDDSGDVEIVSEDEFSLGQLKGMVEKEKQEVLNNND